MLEERGVFPRSCFGDSSIDVIEAEPETEDGQSFEESDNDEIEEDENPIDHAETPGDIFDSSPSSGRRAEEVSTTEIKDAIVNALSKCPNQSCTIHSLASRVLKEVGVLTRGYPRKVFERRVMRCLNALEEQGMIEKYKAKNNRIRLLEEMT
jgi:hypothetical protein